MDNQSAIAIIKNCTTLACEYHIKDKCEKDYAQREDDFEKAKKIAIEAMGKQIPMEHHHTRLSCADDKIRESVCPNCLLVICTEEQSYPKFCCWCGQAIDWGER